MHPNVAAALEAEGAGQDRLWDVATWHGEGANGYESWLSEDHVGEAALWAQLGVPEFLAREARRMGVKPSFGMNLQSTVARIAQSGQDLLVPGTPTLDDRLTSAMREVLQASPPGVLLRGYRSAARLARLPKGWLVAREDGREVRLPDPWAMTALAWFCMLPMRRWYVLGSLDEGEAALMACPFLPPSPADSLDGFVELHRSDESPLWEATWSFDPEWGWPTPQKQERASTCLDQIPVVDEEGRARTAMVVAAGTSGEVFHQLHRLGPAYIDIRVRGQFEYESVTGFRARSDKAAIASFRGLSGIKRAAADSRGMGSPPPKGWTSHAIDRWISKGGSREVAKNLGHLGWKIRESDKALQRAGTERFRIPPLPADHYRSLGDTLVELVAGDWPVPPPGCLLSVKLEGRSGERERFCLTRVAPNLYQIERFRQDDLGWSGDVSELEVSDELEAVGVVLEHTPRSSPLGWCTRLIPRLGVSVRP